MTDDIDFGGDIDSSWSPNSQGDFKTVTGTDTAIQSVYNRLTTKLDELIGFGYINYGNQSYEVLGSTNILVATELIKLYTSVCLLQDPVVSDINSILVSFSINSFQVDVNLQLIGEDTPTNIVFNKS